MCVFALLHYSERGLEGKRRALWWSSDGVICCLMGVVLPIDVQTVWSLGRAKRKGEWGQSCYINQLTKGINTKSPLPSLTLSHCTSCAVVFHSCHHRKTGWHHFCTVWRAAAQSWKCHFWERRGGPGFLSSLLLDLGKAVLTVFFFSNWNPTCYLRS